MSALRNLNQDVTHWPVNGSDGFGGFLFDAPVKLRGRWEEKAELFITPTGEEVASQAVVYLMDDVTNGDFLALGDFSAVNDPNDVPTGRAFRIRNYGKTTDLRNLNVLRKVWL